jgi:methionyl-tRNA formyltransferase
MRIAILTSSTDHPVYPVLREWAKARAGAHDVILTTDPAELAQGDVLFLVSCGHYVGGEIRSKFRNTLVAHASALPAGRGWSPHIWQILEGKSTITLSLIEAGDKIDTGAIWFQIDMLFEGHELYDEINARIFEATLNLMDKAIAQNQHYAGTPQSEDGASTYRKRTPEDSRLDPEQSIAAQFDLLRVADPDRYPCFFEHRGHKYSLSIRKVDEQKKDAQ